MKANKKVRLMSSIAIMEEAYERSEKRHMQGPFTVAIKALCEYVMELENRIAELENNPNNRD